MIRRTVKIVGLTSLFLCPTAAQFGVAGRKKPASFEELKEAAANEAGGIPGMPDMGDFGAQFEQMAEMFNDPKMADAMDQAMKMLAEMSPEDMQKQMEEAMKQLTDGDMVENLMGKKDEVIKSLEESGLVDAEQLARFKSDPEAFEKEMRDAFGQMQNIFSDPALIKDALEGMGNFQNMMEEIDSVLKNDLSDDTKIEEARLSLLSNPEFVKNPAFKELFGNEDFLDSLNDETKWREAVKKGQGMMFANEGAGVGEL